MKSNTNPNPDQILMQLKAGAKSNRTVRSLEIIHCVCNEQFVRGSTDFSITTIGNLSGDRGGPTVQPIRNASGAIYRTLIETWATFAQGKTRKPAAPKAKSLEDDLLAMIDDSVARTLVQSYISENQKLKNENQVLKQLSKEKVTIQFYEGTKTDSGFGQAHISPSLLLDQEWVALRSAICNETMERNGWRVDEATGAVKKGPLPIFSPGFVTAIKKILDGAFE